MAVSVPTSPGGDGKRSVDVELNLVPFIDMMSVMVAFLLITAVWTNLSRIDVAAAAPGRGDEEARPAKALSMLVARDGVWLGVPGSPAERVAPAAVDEAVARLLAARIVSTDTVVEVAAEDAVAYQDVISAMDEVIGKDLRLIRYVEPNALSVRFRE